MEVERDIVEETSLEGEWAYRTDRFHLGGLRGYAREGFNDDGWDTMKIPSNWYREGLDHSGTVWFRHGFDMPEREDGARYHLVFKSVDYKADVTLNGEKLGSHEGYFDEFSYDVTDVIKDENSLAVRVDSPKEPFFSYITGKKYIKGVLDQWDCRPGGLDPFRGRDANTGGIWRDVIIKRTGDYVLGDVKLTPTIRESGADMSVTIPIKAYRDGETTVRIRLTPKNFEGESYEIEQTVDVKEGENEAMVDMSMNGAKKWWTWDMGDPNLYNYEVAVVDGGRVSDRDTGNIGVREFEQREDGGWYLNGKPLFVRGTNYISTQWMSEGPSFYDRDFELLRKANMNGVRVHAHIEDDEFYDRCDENGILVWQDFILQWNYEPKLKDRAVGMMRKMVKNLYNHPSVMVYACHNEPISVDNIGDMLGFVWESLGFGRKGDSPEEEQHRRNTLMGALDGRHWLAQKDVEEFDEALRTAAVEEDPTRLVKVSSPTYEHKYFGWYTGDYHQFREDAANAEPIISEFGAQGLPNMETMRRIFSEKEMEPTNWNYARSWMPKDFQPLQTHMIAGIDRSGSIEDFVANSQDYQARVNKFAIENYRRHKHEPVTALFQFMFVDCWEDAITWSLVDYDRRPKQAFEAVATAYQPVLVSADQEHEKVRLGDSLDVPLWVTNDLYKAYDGASLHATLVDAEGNVIKEQESVIDVDESSSNAFGSMKWTPEAAGDYKLKLELEKEGEVLSRNEYDYEVKEPTA